MNDHSLLLACDLDGTLIGNPEALVRFRHWYTEQVDAVSAIVYASGRFVDSVVEDITALDLPKPVAIIGGLGTQVRLFPSMATIQEWEGDLQREWNAPLVRGRLAALRRLTPQPTEFQSALKASYFLPKATPDELLRIHARLNSSGLAADVIYSSNRDLDVLPAGINKGSAVAYLAWLLGYPKQRVIVCGDSANDLAMFQRRFCGVTVGNAHPELRRLCGPYVFHASRSFADGVLEGVQHWLDSRLGQATVGEEDSAVRR